MPHGSNALDVYNDEIGIRNGNKHHICLASNRMLMLYTHCEELSWYVIVRSFFSFLGSENFTLAPQTYDVVVYTSNSIILHPNSLTII